MKKDKEVIAKFQAAGKTIGFSPKTGEYIVKRGFFYRMGGSAEGLAAFVRATEPRASVTLAVEHWNAWPKNSWWEVRFTI